MTEKTFYTIIAEAHNTDLHITDDLANFCKAKLSRMRTPEVVKNEKLRKDIVSYLKVAGATSSVDLAAHFDVSVNKITGLCTPLVSDGALVRGSVIVNGRAVKSYRVAD